MINITEDFRNDLKSATAHSAKQILKTLEKRTFTCFSFLTIDEANEYYDILSKNQYWPADMSQNHYNDLRKYLPMELKQLQRIIPPHENLLNSSALLFSIPEVEILSRTQKADIFTYNMRDALGYRFNSISSSYDFTAQKISFVDLYVQATPLDAMMDSRDKKEKLYRIVHATTTGGTPDPVLLEDPLLIH